MTCLAQWEAIRVKVQFTVLIQTKLMLKIEWALQRKLIIKSKLTSTCLDQWEVIRVKAQFIVLIQMNQKYKIEQVLIIETVCKLMAKKMM